MSNSHSLPQNPNPPPHQADHAMGCYYMGLIRLSDGLMHRWVVIKGCPESHEGNPRQ